MMGKRLRRVLLFVAVASLVLPGGVTAATPRYPDLGMAALSDIYLTTTFDGRRLLLFSATIVNVGSGQFELVASRADSSSTFQVSQRIFDDGGTSSNVSTPGAELVFAGDGHTHWHVRDLESYELRRLDNGVKVGTGAKAGFCFFDTTAYRLSLAGAPSSPVYGSSGCGSMNSTNLQMGISVGWGDRYGFTLPDQYIDITGLANGKYRLYAEADAAGWFTESNETNNFTWTDIAISTKRNGTVSVRVIGRGPSA